MVVLTRDTLFDAVAIGVVVLDPETGQVVDVNRQYCDVVGSDRNTLVGSELSRPNTARHGQQALLRNLRATVDEGEHRFEWALRNADDEDVPVDLTGIAIDIEGETRVVLTCHDRTERHELEKQTERFRERIDDAMRIGDVAWWEMDIETGDIVCHDNKLAMLGWPEGEFTHYTDFTDRLHPDDYEPAMQSMRDALAGDADRYDIEYRIQTDSGDYLWMHDVGAVTARGPDGEPRTVTGVVIDITELKQVESRFRQQAEELTLLNRLVHHDIRNDMSVISLWLDLLRRDVNDHLDRVTAASDHTLELTTTAREVVDLVGSREHTLDLEPIELHPLLEAEVERVRQSFEGATVELGECPESVAVLANPMLSSVVGNLLNNAVQHDPAEETTVEVSVELDEHTVDIVVADDGPGIEEDLQESLFEHGTAGSKSNGTGLGLYIVKTLVDAYDGSVTVADNEPTGSVFTVTLQRADSDVDTTE
ncbi:PAS domain-containing sensor histidine kinase [Haloarchaeobius sp. DFWS5]|uniref:sensor histidine kinase n=1 Tax=Haloarchaeobius sp. DFWS5 TaxID=3446114 RepID=UPI003EBAC3D0